MSRLPSPIQYQIGDRVWVPIPLGRVAGTVIEDRGPLGPGGEHLFRVEVPNHPYTTEVFLVREEELQHLPAESEELSQSQLDRSAIKEFLIDGGLISILVENSSEPVWLRRGSRGNMTYTYHPGYSRVGGSVPPAYVLEGEQIFSPRKDEVVRFVESFDLPHRDAQDVVRSIGTAP